MFAKSILIIIFALTKKGHVAQLNSALDYGSRGCWFESSRGHKKNAIILILDNCIFVLINFILKTGSDI